MAKKRGVEAIDEQAEGYSGGGIFKKLENHGDRCVVAFAGVIQVGMKGDDAEPVSEEYIWKGGRSEDYDPVKHAGETPKLKIKWNVYDRELKIMQIWTGSIVFYKDWKKLIGKKGLNNWFEIERDGKAGSKKTTYMILDDAPLTDDELEMLKALELKDLEKPLEDEEEDDAPRRSKRKAKASGANGASNGVIDAAQAEKLRDEIKAMADADKTYGLFKEQFGIAKVKELPSEKFDEAATWIANMGKADAPAAEETVENDPFE